MTQNSGMETGLRVLIIAAVAALVIFIAWKALQWIEQGQGTEKVLSSETMARIQETSTIEAEPGSEYAAIQAAVRARGCYTAQEKVRVAELYGPSSDEMYWLRQFGEHWC